MTSQELRPGGLLRSISSRGEVPQRLLDEELLTATFICQLLADRPAALKTGALRCLKADVREFLLSACS